jgi:YebC/PmpR family DNA-binding regulatory protein
VRAKSKARTDGAKTKTFGIFGKRIISAVKSGGSSNPDSNVLLKDTIASARRANVPADNIKRAIERASGKDCKEPTPSLYECYAASGVSMIVSCLTDNQNRAVAEVRNVVNNKFGKSAKMAEAGSVLYMYDFVGRVEFGRTVPEDDILNICMDLNVEDFTFVDGGGGGGGGSGSGGGSGPGSVVYVDTASLKPLAAALQAANIEYTSDELCYKPKVFVDVISDEDKEFNEGLAEALEDLEDVEAITHNME